MPKFEREVEIDAPIEKVWAVLTDPRHWPDWLPGVDEVTSVTSIGEKGQFKWAAEEKDGVGEIVVFEPNKRLKIVTQVEKDKDSHEFKLKSSGGFLGLGADECKVEYQLDTMMGGGIITNFVAGGNPKDALRVKKAMHNFRRLVESM